MKKSLESFKSYFDGDTGLDTRSVYVQAWEEGIRSSEGKKVQRIVTFSADQFTSQIAKEASEKGVSDIGVDFNKSTNELSVAFPQAVITYQVPEIDRTAKDVLFATLLSENNEQGFLSAIKSMPLLNQDQVPAETDPVFEVAAASEEDLDMEKIAAEVDKLTAIANNDLEAYQIEQAAAQLREAISEDEDHEEF